MTQATQSYLTLPGASAPIPMTLTVDELRDRLKHIETAAVRNVLTSADGYEIVILPGTLSWYATHEPKRASQSAGF